jgi:8-oxo-dGTP pyrophosphatase MutT (NUDIX family)
MGDRTLCFLIRGNPPTEILLGFKKAGFGAGKYAGISGKVEPGETTAMAAARELSFFVSAPRHYWSGLYSGIM